MVYMYNKQEMSIANLLKWLTANNSFMPLFYRLRPYIIFFFKQNLSWDNKHEHNSRLICKLVYSCWMVLELIVVLWWLLRSLVISIDVLDLYKTCRNWLKWCNRKMSRFICNPYAIQNGSDASLWWTKAQIAMDLWLLCMYLTKMGIEFSDFQLWQD